jgi:uncharacterized protein YjdB
MTNLVSRTLWLPLFLAIILSGCGGKNGLIGGGQNVQLKSIALTPSNPTLALTVAPDPPATAQFVAIGTYSVGNPQDITKQVAWLSADQTVATTDSNGIATAVGSGRTIITAQMLDQSTGKLVKSQTILTVVPQLTSVTVTPASAKIARGTTQRFIATGNFNDKSTLDVSSQVTWASSQPAAATVSASPGTQGLATGVSQGSSNITATLGSLISAPASMTVTNANLVSLVVTPPGSLTVPLATSRQLVATGTFDDGSKQDLSRDVAWTTVNSHSRVARVSSAGMVRGLGLGAETVVATAPSSGITASTDLAVDESSVAGVSVLPIGMVLFPGAQSPKQLLASGTKQQMRAVATLKDGSTVEATGIPGIGWSSSNTSVATIDGETGLLTAGSSGSSTISAALGSQHGSTSVNVTNATLQSLVVGPNNAQVAQGGIQNMLAWGTFLAPDNVTLFQQDVSNAAVWSSDPTASVNYVNGLQELAIGAETGTANISASLSVPGGSSANGTALLNISGGELNTINLAPGSAAVPTDGSRQFIATGNFTDGTQSDLSLLATWGSADDAVTTVTPFGFAGASGPGQTSITASFLNPVSGNPVAGSSAIVVNPAALRTIDICAGTVVNPLVNCPPLDLFPPPSPVTFAAQTQFPLVAIGTYTDGSRQDLTDAVWWTSGSPKAMTVSNDSAVPGITTGVGKRGVLTGGVQGGTSSITATAGGVSGTASVTTNPVTLQSLAITPPNSVTTLGIPAQFAVVGLFSDGSHQDVTASALWSSLNPDIAIVNRGGLAYTIGKGMSNISQDPSRLVVEPTLITVTMMNPSATDVFPWPVGSVFQFHGLLAASGDISTLNDKPFTILSESDPTDRQQPCMPAMSCDIKFAPPAIAPAQGAYTVTAGTGQASAVIKAIMNVTVNSVLTQFTATTTLTVQ